MATTDKLDEHSKPTHFQKPIDTVRQYIGKWIGILDVIIVLSCLIAAWHLLAPADWSWLGKGILTALHIKIFIIALFRLIFWEWDERSNSKADKNP